MNKPISHFHSLRIKIDECEEEEEDKSGNRVAVAVSHICSNCNWLFFIWIFSFFLCVSFIWIGKLALVWVNFLNSIYAFALSMSSAFYELLHTAQPGINCLFEFLIVVFFIHLYFGSVLDFWRITLCVRSMETHTEIDWLIDSHARE